MELICYNEVKAVNSGSKPAFTKPALLITENMFAPTAMGKLLIEDHHMTTTKMFRLKSTS